MRRAIRTMTFLLVVSSAALFVHPAGADHQWGNYHWNRTGVLDLDLGDNVDNNWQSYLVEASSDWNSSTVLDTTIVPGSTRPKSCRPSAGRVEVCNARYGGTGWLGVAQIWASGSHITQAIVKLNDTYFSTASYNTPAWRRLVTCQEVGHTFGLDHQDENFSNPNLGTCMDYTSDPDGPPSNEHPNAHDYEMLETIYAHNGLMGTDSVAGGAMPPAMAEIDLAGPAQWGRVIERSDDGRPLVYVADFGNGHRVFTFVVWTRERGGHD